VRLTARIRSLERKRDGGLWGGGCAVCGGAGWPTVVLFNEPPTLLGARPPGWPVGCPACGRRSHEMVVSLGPSPTLAEARAFMEAI
jgi:hypothetical protein